MGDIEGLLYDKDFWKLDPLPITKQRIVSKIRNPRAGKEDLALAAAYEKGRIIGYCGIFSDKLFLNGGPQKAGCFTTAWVDPGKRRHGILTQLMGILIKAYDGRVYVSEMSEPAKKSLDKGGRFTALKPMKFYQVAIRISMMDLLPKRVRLSRNAAPAISGIEMLCNLPVKTRLNLWKLFNSPDSKFHVEYLAEIDQETGRFIDKYQKNELFRRGAAELDWITRYPWVIQAPFPDVNGSRFFFSSIARSFSYIKFRILDLNGRIRAFAMLKLRDGHLQVPYAYFDESDRGIVAGVLCHHMVGLGAKKFETCNARLVGEMKNIKFPIVKISVRDRHTRLSNELARGADLDAISLQDGDGDKVFT